MNRNIAFLVLLLLSELNALNAQDVIIKKNGEQINCKITSIDSVNIYFTTENNRELITHLNKKEIKTFYFESQTFYAKTHKDTTPFTPDYFKLGLGIGLDYGGLGLKVIGYPQKNVGLFIAVGYAIIDLGYNAGVKLRLISKDQFQTFVPYVLGMYGYNTVIKVENAGNYDKFFYGPSIGLGFDIYPNRKKENYWSLGIVFPIRGHEVDEYIQELKTNHNVTFKNSLSSVLVSIGFNM